MGRSSKKKFYDEAAKSGIVVDPLENLQIGVENYDINRKVYIYSDNTGERWWTKAWFNSKDNGEIAIPITKLQAQAFINNEVTKDDWLSRYYPKQMEAIRKSIVQTRMQLLSL